MFWNKPKEDSGPQGGIGFFISLLVLSLVLRLTLGGIWSILPHIQTERFVLIGFSALSGFFLAPFFIKGAWSVVLHEWKHSFISSLAGNKAKEFVVEGEAGHFQYEYTKSSKGFNAFIALAPYIVVIFVWFGIALPYAFKVPIPEGLGHAALVAFLYGIDLNCNTRDISPIQTDITNIRGGYLIGLSYIVLMNLVVGTMLLSWLLGGTHGLLAVFKEMYWFFETLMFQKTSV